MWGKILIGLVLASIMSCHGSAIPCNPQLPNTCPNGPNGAQRICDPTGICQIACTSNNDCSDPGTICDFSAPSTALCQTDCSNNKSLCSTGQTCYTYNVPVQTGATPISQQTCKQLCTSTINSCAATNQNFVCQTTTTSSISFCWGAIPS